MVDKKSPDPDTPNAADPAQTNPQPSDYSDAPKDGITYEVTIQPGRPITTDLATYNEHKVAGLVVEGSEKE